MRKIHRFYTITLMLTFRFFLLIQPNLAYSMDKVDKKETEVCSRTQEIYSKDQWQYGKFTLCIKSEENEDLHEYNITTSVRVSDLQYFWGSAWYENKKPWVLVINRTLSRNGTTIKLNDLTCRGSLSDTLCVSILHTSISGKYGLSVTSTLSGMEWADSPLVTPAIKTQDIQVGQLWEESYSLLKHALSINTEENKIYIFGKEHQIPIVFSNGEKASLWKTGSLMSIPHGTKLISTLIGDFNLYPSSRCEKNKSATVGDLHQNSEVFSPVKAWGRLDGPLIAMSVNYFDTRIQANKKTWIDTQCSSIYGYYADALNLGPYQGTPSQQGPYPYNPYFINSTNNKEILDTLSFVDSYKGEPASIDIQLNKDEQASASKEKFTNLNQGGSPFNFTSGVSLIPENISTFSKTGNIDPNKPSRRIAFGYDSPTDRVYISSIGANEQDGINRIYLKNFLSVLPVNLAMEFFSGESANLVVRDDGSVIFYGEKKPLSLCSDSGAWCYFNGENKAFPSPSWLGIYDTQ